MKVYHFDIIPKQLLIEIISYFDEKSFYNFKRTSLFCSEVISDKLTFNYLLNKNFKNVNLKYINTKNPKKTYFLLLKSKILKVYKYSKYLFDISLQSFNDDGDRSKGYKLKNFSDDYLGCGILFPCYKVNKPFIKYLGYIYKINDINRKTIHIVDNNQPFVIMNSNYPRNFDYYIEDTNLICVLKNETVNFNFNEELSKELVSGGYYI